MEKLNSSTEQQPESCDTLVIDGDAIPYMLGWHHRDHNDVITMYGVVDTWMNDFLTITKADKFIGILANDNSRCFRYDVYKYAAYKGNRSGEKEPWIVYWEPIIRKHLQDKWGFVQSPSWLETDDIVAALALGNPKAIICSPDKDLKQIPGYFYNYKDLGGETHKGLETVDAQQAYYNLCYQLICGDSTDNIAGVNGMGDVKAKKLLAETSPMLWMNEVKLAYNKQYGRHYGPIIYTETLHTIQMMTSSHPLYEQCVKSYGNWMEPFDHSIRKSSDYVRSVYSSIEREESV